MSNFKCYIKKFGLALSLAALTSAGAGIGNTVAAEEERIFQNGREGYGGASSAMIKNGETGQHQNSGKLPALVIGGAKSVERRALLQFDLRSLAGANVTRDGELEVVQVNVGFTEGILFDIRVYVIAPGNAGWEAGEGQGEMAQNGEVSWSALAMGSNSEAKKKWAGESGLQKAGVDYDEAPIFVWPYDGAKEKNIITIPVPRDVLQAWIDRPDENGGLLFTKNYLPDAVPGSMGAFYSVEKSDVSLRPRLKVFFEH